MTIGEIIDHALYAAAAIALAAVLWPRRKGVPMNCEQQEDGLTVQKLEENRREMQQEEAQEDDYGYAKLMLKAAAINERVQAMNYIDKIQNARQAIWMDNPQVTMSWDEYARQQTTAKPQSRHESQREQQE